MVNAFLVVSVIVMAVIILVLAVFLIIYFGHPDDRSEAKFPKLIVVCNLFVSAFSGSRVGRCLIIEPIVFIQVFGIWLAFGTVLILPYDVASSSSKDTDSGGIRVDVLWQIAYICMACMVVFIIPFAFYFYEAGDDEYVRSLCDMLRSANRLNIVALNRFLVCFTKIGTAPPPRSQLPARAPSCSLSCSSSSLSASSSTWQ